MKLALLATLLAASIPLLALAEDALVEGGRSPDGRYQVRLGRALDYDAVTGGSEYLFEVRSSNGDKVGAAIGGSGFRSYRAAAEYCRALWDGSSRFVALTDRETRHTNTLHVVVVSGGTTQLLEVPPYVENALGRVDAVEIDFACASTPVRWEGDDLIVQLGFTANGRRSYTCEVTLHVIHPDNVAPSLQLKAVTKPEESEG